MVNWRESEEPSEEVAKAWDGILEESVGGAWPPKTAAVRENLVRFARGEEGPTERRLAIGTLYSIATASEANEEAVWADDQAKGVLLGAVLDDTVDDASLMEALLCLRALSKKHRPISAEVWAVAGQAVLSRATRHGCCCEALKLLVVLSRCPDCRLQMFSDGAVAAFDAALKDPEKAELDFFDVENVKEARTLLRNAHNLVETRGDEFFKNGDKRAVGFDLATHDDDDKSKSSFKIARGFFRFSETTKQTKKKPAEKPPPFGLHERLARLRGLASKPELNGLVGYVVNFDGKAQRYVFEKRVASFDDKKPRLFVKRENLEMVLLSKDVLSKKTVAALQTLVDAAPRRARIALPPLCFRSDDPEVLSIRDKDALALVGSARPAAHGKPSTVLECAVDALVDGPLTLGRVEVRGSVGLASTRGGCAVEKVFVDSPYGVDSLSLTTERGDVALDACFVEGGDNGIVLDCSSTHDCVLRGCTVLGSQDTGIVAKSGPVVLEDCTVQFCVKGAVSGEVTERGDANKVQTEPEDPSKYPQPPPPPKSMDEAKFEVFQGDAFL